MLNISSRYTSKNLTVHLKNHFFYLKYNCALKYKSVQQNNYLCMIVFYRTYEKYLEKPSSKLYFHVIRVRGFLRFRVNQSRTLKIMILSKNQSIKVYSEDT